MSNVQSLIAHSADTAGIHIVVRRLEGRRTEKGERITSNTVIRDALRVFLEHFGDDPDEVANNEEELLELVRRNLGRI